eukprot:TRINITY_DN4198_c0_g1_i1.p1 TRINITY_DN4198_c0_g1~~TRINITY_DN4198_c0_g1_i1.p1  ORF type:complete len:116 (+),score=14.85 TRINITY_DN4198_c0_g1_i1:495-842(+)
MSSRNRYLSPEERVVARSLSQALFSARTLVSGGETRRQMIIDCVKRGLQHPMISIDYVSLASLENGREISSDILDISERGVLLSAAIKIGFTRLIDNLMLSTPFGTTNKNVYHSD